MFFGWKKFFPIVFYLCLICESTKFRWTCSNFNAFEETVELNSDRFTGPKRVITIAVIFTDIEMWFDSCLAAVHHPLSRIRCQQIKGKIDSMVLASSSYIFKFDPGNKPSVSIFRVYKQLKKLKWMKRRRKANLFLN